MRLTAAQTVSQLPVKPTVEQLERYANKETRPLLEQLRAGVNARGIERPAPVVSDGAGTFVTLWTSDVLPQECLWTVEAHVDGSGATVRARYVLQQSAESVAGVVAAVGLQNYDDYESAAACDARISVDAVNRVVTVEARDAATEVMQWTAVVYVAEGKAAE